MIRIERFKQLLRERIAEYQASYDASKSQMMFGALQEAKDTLEYIEKQFPSIINGISVKPQEVKVTVEVQALDEEGARRIRRVATNRITPEGNLLREEHIMEEQEYWIIESFFQFLVAERSGVFKWHKYPDMIGAELLLVPPRKVVEEEE